MTYLTPRIGFSKRLILLFIFHLLSYLGVALLLTPHFTYAATYTVSPGQSLQDAINQLRGGDTLIINSGTYTPSTTQDNCPITRIPSGAGGATITVASGASVTWIGAVELGNGSPLTNITIDGTPGTLLFDGQRCGGFIISGEVHDTRFEKFEVSHPNMGFVGELINTQFIDLNIHHSGRDDQGKRSQECADGLGIPLDPNASGHCHAIYCSSTCSGN